MVKDKNRMQNLAFTVRMKFLDMIQKSSTKLYFKYNYEKMIDKFKEIKVEKSNLQQNNRQK